MGLPTEPSIWASTPATGSDYTPGVAPDDYVACAAPPFLDVDFYKVGHVHQYPKGTTVVYSNMTPRNDKHAEAKMNPRVWDYKAVVFGLQAFIKEYLIDTWNRDFFQRPWSHVEYEYRESVDTGLNTVLDISHLKALHTLGYLPVEIRALPEGIRVGMKIPVFTIHNTLPEFYWLTNALETVLSNETWKPMVAATIAANYRATAEYWSQVNGSPDYMLQWGCHDFSSRGMSGRWDSRACGMAHLLAFTGTDTVSAIHAARLLYNAEPRRHFVGGSVPATEHSVMCIDGSDKEFDTYVRLLALYTSGIVSIVSDTYDFWQVITVFTRRLYDTIMAREGRVVFRPDSGNPLDIITGTAITVPGVDRNTLTNWLLDHGHIRPEGKTVVCDGSFYRVVRHPIDKGDGRDWHYYTGELLDSATVPPEVKGAYYCLYEVFGGAKNSKGFIDLDPHVGLIYGDSITPQLYDAILKRLTDMGFSHSNLVVGVGSYTYQYVTRDTLGAAVKATYGAVKGVGRAIIKDPKTDPGKKSATGLLVVQAEDGDYKLLDGILAEPTEVMGGNFGSGELVPTFRNGQLLVDETLSNMRARLGWSDAYPAA